MSDPGSTPQGDGDGDGDGTVDVSDRHLPDRRAEETVSKVPTLASKLERIALGLMLTVAVVLLVFLAWAAIFWALSYLVGWR
jgi:hypothetical protein